MRAAILVALVLGLAPPAPAGEDEAAEIYRFEIDEPAYAAKVVVRRDRFCEVTFKDSVTSSDIRLAPEDLKTFERLLNEAHVRDDPLPPARPRNRMEPPPLTGSLRLFRDGSPVVSAIQPWGRTADVARWLERLTTEAIFLRGLQDDESRTCSLPRPEEVLHPTVRREALERAIATRRWPDSVIVALAQVVPCDEWVRVIEKRMRCGDPSREDSLVGALAWVDGETLPKEHREARVGLLVETLERIVNGARSDTGSCVADALCRERYLPALPLIVRGIGERGARWSDSLHEFGFDALDPLSRLLESPSSHVRAIAVSSLCLLVAELDRRPREERRAILDRLHVEFTLKIREIARHDPDETIQAGAGRTLAALAWAVFGEEAGPEVFSFDGWGSLIRVRSDGRCEERSYGGAISSHVKLTPGDLGTFERLAGEARLREDPPRCPPPRWFIDGGPGDTFLGLLLLDGNKSYISTDGRTADIARWLGRLMTEAEFLRAVQDAERPFILPDPEDLLHPSVLKESLERALPVWEFPATIVDALARVASREEWARVVEERFRYADERGVDGLAMALAWCDGLPVEHRDARVRILLDVFRREYAGDFDRGRREAARRVAEALCHARCQPAIPIIVRMIEQADDEWRNAGFEDYGVAALDPLAKLLDSPNPFARRFAVRCVRSLADRVAGHPDVLPRLRLEFTLKIREIARHDTDGTAQTLAGHALVAIARGVYGG